jgi:SPP1 family predicted phage head-tail adaptor
MMKYHIGEFRELIKIEEEALTPDGVGGHTVALTTIYDGWALVRPLSVRERLNQDQLEASGRVVFIIRNNYSITETMRVTWNNEKYNILGLNKRGAGVMYLEIQAERGVAL